MEVALLRMTEKKMMLEMALEAAQKTIKEKDETIAQLKQLVMQL